MICDCSKLILLQQIHLLWLAGFLDFFHFLPNDESNNDAFD